MLVTKNLLIILINVQPSVHQVKRKQEKDETDDDNIKQIPKKKNTRHPAKKH